MSKKKFTNKSVEYLDFLANHFAHRDWNYTRDTNIERIVYVNDERDSLKRRLNSSFGFLLTPKKRGFLYDNPLKMRIWMFFYCLKKERNLPDGHLDDGNVITHWEETGEYLQMVQPSVGALLADFLREDPEHPNAKKIIAELDRLRRSYGKRIKEGKTNTIGGTND